MQAFDFRPKLEDAEDFYKKVQKRRAKLKEINEIEAFNKVNHKASADSESFDKQFDLAEWKMPQNNNNDQSFFKQQGKTLLSDQQCFKKIDKVYLLSDAFFHTAIIYWSFLDDYSIWTYLSNFIMAIFAVIFLAFHFKSAAINQLYSQHKSKLLKMYKTYECSLIISIMLSSTAILHGLFVLYQDVLLIHSIKILLYLVTIYIQLKLLKNVKYNILVQSELNKQSSSCSLQQTDAYEFG